MSLSRLRLLATRPAIQKMVGFGKTVFSPKYLIYTNVLISGQLAAFGDVIQQAYQRSKPDSTTDAWDLMRTARMFTAGIVLGPTVHWWYLGLDKFIPGSTVRTVMIKLIPDLFLFSPGYILLFLFVTGALEGESWSNFKKSVKDKSGGLFSVEFFLWTPAQFVNFYFLPTRFRVLYDNGVSLIADVLYSYFRYDYEVDDDDDEEDFKTSQNAIGQVKEKANGNILKALDTSTSQKA